MIKIRTLYLKLTGALLCVLLSGASSPLAASTMNDKNSCANIKLTEKRRGQGNAHTTEYSKRDVETQVKALLCRAQRAEASAAWHEERGRAWDEVAERQESLRALDLTSLYDPQAAFISKTHRNQREKMLRQAQSLREQARLMAAKQDSQQSR